jgi:dolichol-phosphate mannosyltransferase
MKSIKEKNFASAVVYCYNDAETIGLFLAQLDKTLDRIFLHYEIIVVNDDSTDESVNIVKKYVAGKEEKRISLLNMSHYQGLETSMNAGVDLSIGDFVFEFDFAYADFDWEMLLNVYHHSLSGYDIVSASPQQKPRLISRLYYAIFNRYAKLQNNIGIETFRLLSRRAINRIHSITQSIPYRKAAYANCGLSIDTLKYKPIQKVIRKKHADRSNVAMDSLILFTDVAYRVTVGLAVIMAIIAAAFAIYALAYWFMSTPVEGWTTTIILIAFGFFGLFIILAMVIKYLQTLVSLSFRKKEYLYESIEKLQ